MTQLPKVELHCHLDGILDPRMATAIRRARPDFPVDPEQLRRAYPVHDLDSFVNWWSYLAPIAGRLGQFSPILGGHIERLRAQRVVYAEVMIAAGELPDDASQAVEAVQGFREEADSREQGDVQVEFLVAFGRNKPVERCERIADRILALHRAGLIAGVALAGPEQGHPVEPLRHIFARFHEAGLGVEIHAGEWCGPESVRDALTHGRPDRLGHAVSLFQDQRLIDIVRERRIHLEFCPTSNLRTGSIRHIDEHPIGRAHELGLSFSVNTDDPGPFECDLTSEYELLARVFGFGEADFQRIFANSLQARFQPRLRGSLFDPAP